MEPIIQYASYLNSEHKLEDHNLFKFIKSDQCTPLILSEILTPFYFAVSEWKFHLSQFYGILQILEDDESADLIAENIDDETGNPEKMAHTETYINFLRALGKLDTSLTNTDSVKKFNTEISNMLYDIEMPIGELACVFGGIEHFYITVSTFFHDLTKNVYNVHQEHYSLHEVLDVKHSTDFFRVALNQNVSQIEYINGLKEGYRLLWNLYDDLYNEYLMKN